MNKRSDPSECLNVCFFFGEDQRIEQHRNDKYFDLVLIVSIVLIVR